jgi:hypothetical protein
MITRFPYFRGPWKISNGRTPNIKVESVKGVVCRLNDEGNARLIRSAPDLVDTLEAIAAMGDDDMYYAREAALKALERIDLP